MRVSAHHAILEGVVFVNGECCKQGRTVLNPGDVVSLKLQDPISDNDLIAWHGSAAVADKLVGEGKNISHRTRDVGKRKGRMMPALEDDLCTKRNKHDNHAPESAPMVTQSMSPFIQYYRSKLASLWKPDIHEVAMSKPLPLTIRAIKPSSSLHAELSRLGFRKVRETDFSLNLYNQKDGAMRTLDIDITQELLSNTWIMAKEELYQSNAEKKYQLGVFLSDARISGEILQQELNSMLPVSILAAALKKTPNLTKQRNLRVLDLCAAPGSKTCQLLNVLDNLLKGTDNKSYMTDFIVVANELASQRASRTQTRCFFQGNATTSHLIVTAGDGRKYANMQCNYFDFILW